MKDSAERAVKHVATDNFNSYPKNWIEDDDLQGFVNQLWDVRNEREIERDEEAGVTEDDYYNWAEEAFMDWFDMQAQYLDISEKEKEAYLEHLNRVGYDKSFEMFKDQWL